MTDIEVCNAMALVFYLRRIVLELASETPLTSLIKLSNIIEGQML